MADKKQQQQQRRPTDAVAPSPSRLPWKRQHSTASSSSSTDVPSASATAGRRRTKLFPLADDFFPPIHVTEEQADRYEEQMERIVQEALDEYAAHEALGAYPVYRAPWSLIGNVDTLTTIRKEDPAHPTPSRARIFGRINGNYRHFIDFFYAETSRQLFEWNKFMFGYVVDAQVLRNIHTAASGRAHLYMGVKWTCLQPSTLVKRRDNVYLEYLAHTKDAKGRDVGVRVTLPLDLPQCPSLPPKLKTKRIRLYTVWISRAVPEDPFETDFFMLSENDFNGLAVTGAYYKKMMNILKDMAVFVDSRRILAQGMVARNDWVAGDARRNCKLCSRKFHAARRRHHCRLCGEVICRRCVIVRDAPKGERSAGDKTFKVVKTKFCMLCVTKMREADDSGIHTGLITASSATDGDCVPEGTTSVAFGTTAAGAVTVDVPINVPVVVEAALQDDKHGGSDDYSHSDWEYDERSSTWSETESEDGKLSLYSNSELDDDRSSLSARSDSSMDKMSFMTTLEAIQDDATLSGGVELSSDFTTDASHVPRQQSSRSVDAATDVAETIDTTDMLPVSRLSLRNAPRMSGASSGGRGSATAFGSDDGDKDFFSAPRPSYSHSVMSNGSLPKSPRTLDQSLAEQEELLRRMLAATGYPRSASSSVSVSPTGPGLAVPPASSPVQMAVPAPAVRSARTRVKLYEV